MTVNKLIAKIGTHRYELIFEEVGRILLMEAGHPVPLTSLHSVLTASLYRHGMNNDHVGLMQLAQLLEHMGFYVIQPSNHPDTFAVKWS